MSRFMGQVENARHRLSMPHHPQIENAVWAELHTIEAERDRLREAADALRNAVSFLRSCDRSGEHGADHTLVVGAIGMYDEVDRAMPTP